MRFTFGLILYTFLFTACASKFFVPGNRFLTPESVGGTLKGDLKISAVGVTDVQVADNVESLTPNLTPRLSKNTALGLGTQLGAVDRVDGYFNLVVGGYNAVGMKLQFFGESAPTAKTGNLSLSMAGGVVFGTQRTAVDTGSNQGKAEASIGGWEGLMMLGYRPVDAAILYLMPFYTRITANVTVARTNGGAANVTAQPDGVGEMRGATLGVRSGKNAFVALEGAYTEMVWKRVQPSELETSKFSDFAVGLAIGGNW